jgi:hypothetical protein
MDAQWKAETDARLNALQSQLASTRKLALGLAILAIALGGYGAAATLRKPKKIVLESADGSLTLAPSAIRMKIGKETVSIGIGGINVADSIGKNTRTTNVSASSVRLATGDGASLTMNASDTHGSITMSAPTGAHATMSAGPLYSRVDVSQPHDKGVTMEASKDSAKVSGIGKTFFGIGDGGPYGPPPDAAKPGCDPFGQMHGCQK